MIEICNIWLDIFQIIKLPLNGTIVEIAPGSVPKIGSALKRYGFAGTVYIVEPEPYSMKKILEEYSKLLPDAKIVGFNHRLINCIEKLPVACDAILSNHPIDDMIIGETMAEDEFKNFFFDHYNSSAEDTRVVWDRIKQNPVQLGKSIRNIEKDWKDLITYTRPRNVVISQYGSYFFKENNIKDPDYYGQKVLKSIKEWAKSIANNVSAVEHSLIKEPENWLIIGDLK